MLIGTASETINATGDVIPTHIRRVSYAEILSPMMRETYEALTLGFKPEFVAVLPSWYDDYHGEALLEYRGQLYDIRRAYRAQDLSCELTVSRFKAGASFLDAPADGVQEV